MDNKTNAAANQTTMKDFVEDFRDAMRKGGLDYAGAIIPDGKLRRFKANGGHRKDSWYVLHPPNNKIPAAGCFGCWKRNFTEKWHGETSENMSSGEWAAYRDGLKRLDEERERAEMERREKARKNAAWILLRSQPMTTHPYLKRKAVSHHGELSARADLLVLPLRDAAGDLHSLQFIAPDKRFDGERDKSFLCDGKIEGTFFVVSDRPDGALVICEGYATGASIFEATGLATVCAMNCGNLLAVAKAVRGKFPEREIIIAADNDQWTDGNPGLAKATEAAKAIDANVAGPGFANVTTKPTDFNDLHQLEGLDVVKAQIESAAVPKETDEEAYRRLAALPPAEYDRSREDEARRLNIRVGTLDGEVQARRIKTSGNVQCRAMDFPEIEPWPKSVDGAELLNDIVTYFEKFCVLPAYTPDVLAVWCLQSWCYKLFDFAAIIAVWSPEPECGKGRVLDAAEKIVRHPFRTSNTSAAVLYHVINEGNVTGLIDEFDSISNEQREAVCNILKGGFQSNGMAHRMAERNGEQVVVNFSTYCPKMIATITMDKLDKATRSRTIGIHMQRKPRSQKVAKFRRVDTVVLRRKCLRWVQDNAEAIKAVPPMDIDECATDRQEDVWEPLVAIARVAGGEWENQIRLAAQHLTHSGSDGATDTVSHQLLAALKLFFDEHGDRADTKTIVAALKEAGDFDDVNHGKGLTPQYVARLLKPYGIEPRVQRTGRKNQARGYSRDQCEQTFATYLSDAAPKKPPEKCNSVTTLENIERNTVFENVTKGDCYVSVNVENANSHADWYGVTDQKAKTQEQIAKQADLI